MNNPFRAAQNPQATRPQYAPALADVVVVAVVVAAKLFPRAQAKTRPRLKSKTPPRPHLRQLKPVPQLRQPLRLKRAQPNHRNHPLAQNALIVRSVPNVPRPNHSPHAARPSRFARLLNARPSNARLLNVNVPLSNEFSI